jgi:hypothetical protein
MDPWVDFVGVPKEKVADDGVSYLELIRMEDFARDEVEALFFDEFNRSKDKVRNAVMELMQFKSINGKPFKNLKVIWAAVNPYDEEETYDVEKIDPAQEDRFHIKTEIKYRPDKAYFKKKYGEDLATPAISWWNKLTQENKDRVSPRRLDYALEAHTKNADLSDFLEKEVGVQALVNALNAGPAAKRLKELYENNDPKEIKNFFANDNKYEAVLNSFLRNQDYLRVMAPHLPEEKIALLMADKPKFYEHVCNNIFKEPFCSIVENIVTAKSNKKLRDKLLDKFPWLSMTVNQYLEAMKRGAESTLDRRRKYATVKNCFQKMYRLAGSDKNTNTKTQQELAFQTYHALVDIGARSNSKTLEEFSDLDTLANDAFKLLQNADQEYQIKLEQVSKIAASVNKKSFKISIAHTDNEDDLDQIIAAVEKNKVKKSGSKRQRMDDLLALLEVDEDKGDVIDW